MEHKFVPVVHRIDPAAELTGTHELTGGMSAQITVLELDRTRGPAKLIVREYGEKNRLADPTPRPHRVHPADLPALLRHPGSGACPGR